MRLSIKTFLIFIMMFGLFMTPKAIFAKELNYPPSTIIIPKISVFLPVFTARVAYNTWEVRTDGASFGEHTTYPGNIGNTVIFSHARPGLFIDLPKLEKGDYIHVFTETDWFVYKVTNVLVVQPEDTDVIFSGHTYELTLFTCTGVNYSQRFIVKAELTAYPQSSF